MSRVVMPQAQSNDSTGKVLTGLGALAGGYIGATTTAGAGTQAGATTGAMMGGALSGAATGAGVGGTAGSLLSKQSADAPGIQGSRDAISRRAAALQPIKPEDYAPTLASAETAASQLPPDLQKQYLPALQKARSMNGTGVA